MQKELKEAVNDTRGVPAEYLTTAVRDSVGPIMATSSAMPSKASIRFVSVRWKYILIFTKIIGVSHQTLTSVGGSNGGQERS